MKILFISAVCPLPQHSGGQIRVFQLLKRLGKKHKITLLCFIRTEAEKKYKKELEKYCHEVHFFFRGRVWNPLYLFRAAMGKQSLLATSYDHPDMKHFIKVNHKVFDTVHIEPYYVYPVLPEKINKFIVAEHNVEYNVYSDFVDRSSFFPPINLLMRYDISKMKYEEQNLWNRAKNVIVVSETDKQILQTTNNNIHVSVVPNGVDTKYYSFFPRSVDKKHLHFLFVGNFLWTPNMQAIKLLLNVIWPQLISVFSDAKLTVVGKHLENKLRQNLPKQVLYLESVIDMRQFYQTCTALISPTKIAGGTKYKILESFASGLPIITTAEGIYGLAVRHKEHVLTVDNTFDYVQAVRWLLENKQQREQMVDNARSLVTREYDWDNIAQKQDSLWESIAC